MGQPRFSRFPLEEQGGQDHDLTAMLQHADDGLNSLVEAARRGDRIAFDRAVQMSHRALLGFLRAHMPADLVEPEVVAQKVWIAVWDGLRLSVADGGFDPDRGSFHAFVCYRYAVYILRREMSARAKQRAREVSLERWEEETGRGTGAAPADDASPWGALAQAESLRVKLAAFREVFRILFLCGGYPHQQLAVAFSKYVYGENADRVQRVDREHGSVPLAALADDLAGRCRTMSEAPAEAETDWPDTHLRPLRMRLSLRLDELMKSDPTSREHFHALGARQSGETNLADYCAEHKGGFTAAIPDWCYKVEKRVRQILGVGDEPFSGDALEKTARREGVAGGRMRACGKCKLRAAPPCGNVRSERVDEVRPREGAAGGALTAEQAAKGRRVP